ncbi:hypothetical protein [Kutzneria buriramensis]|uniref:Putative membrane-anchored protein n=1 Tax=Kutzneria buriramensis TaxID=1045776 RepID=A0A3E0GU04_9PSEU|nr:hypothetical protein [Kutzneria buriramensis]REH27681.1 putative membrane-anchored protein [Kutzneria buriramensis]
MTTEQVRPKIGDVRPLLNKVPQVTAIFWVIKVLTTGMGETTSDFFLLSDADPSVPVSVAFLALIAALVAQISVRRHITWLYWATVVLVSVVGTMVADIMHYMFDVPYVTSTVSLSIVLTVIFAAWYGTERTLSIGGITTRRREIFYWLTVMATFALGTAAGDLVADTANLGYFGAGVLFAVAIAVPGLARKAFGLNATVAFWAAYVLTRPLGASFADLFGMPAENGGLDLGLGPVSLVLTAAIVVLVGFSATRRQAPTGV